MILKNIENILAKVNEPIANTGKRIAGLLLIMMTSIVLLQVFYRYLLGSPLTWTDELSSYLMIYMTYLCLPLIYLTDQNIAMTFLVEKIKGKRISHLVMFFVHIFALLTIAVWIYFGWAFFLKGNVMANSLPFKMYYIYLVPPLLFCITLLQVMQKIISELNNFINYQKIN
ncbi:TRAP transporter small permease [Lonepinella koalarum]|uniref:TRAP transporter small permease n=1 Tax=Lonepinella koalarum TaxID=53417 RepID=UPI001E50B527|nr:TRAP transporter small permease [Lonepinella koalarum]